MSTTNYYCDSVAGNDSAGDGTIGNPYKTLQKVETVIFALGSNGGADSTIWLKGSGIYPEEVTVREQCKATSGAVPLIVEGYTTTPGDGGMATMDGEGSKDFAITLAGSGDNNNYFWHWKNVRFTDYVINCIDGVHGANSFYNDVTFDHCRFDNSPIGVQAGSGYRFHDCWFHDCSSYGVEGTRLNNHWEMRCIFEDCGIGLHLHADSNSGSIWNCLFIGNTTANIQDSAGLPIVNCVIDGNSKASAIGVEYPAGASIVAKIFNTIILDCTTGVDGPAAGAEEMSLIKNSCFYLNTSNFSRGAAARSGCIFVDPQFVDRANKDYGIIAASPCKEAGLDLESYDWYTSTASKVDIGFVQENRSGSGGLNIGAPQGFSVER